MSHDMSVAPDSPTESNQPSRADLRVRSLIVNADDFGRSEAVNAGVAEGFRRGILTSTSIVAAGPAFESAVASASHLKGLGIGVHLVLDEYEPVLPPSQIPRLVDSNGRFFSRGQQYWRMVSDSRIKSELLREWEAQISRILNAGITLTHIDGHGHCHAHPAAADLVLQLSARYGIAHVRFPAEPMSWRSGQIMSVRFGEKAALGLATQLTRTRWEGKLIFPRSFYGFSHGGHMSRALVRRVMEAAPPGVSELMVHVGISNNEAPGFHTGYDWMGDLDAVTSHTKPEFEKEFDVRLVTHTQGV